jgi:hypothetical protein
MAAIPLLKKVIISVHRNGVENEIRQTKEVDLLKIPIADFKKMRTKGREKLINGKHYDFVKTKSIAGQKYALLWEDEKEASLFAFFKDMAKRSNPFATIHFLFMFVGMAVIAWSTFNDWSLKTGLMFFYRRFQEKCFLDSELQPPELN